MKIVYFWTWPFSAQILSALFSFSEIEIVAVVSQPDKPVWRKMELLPTPVKKVGLEHHIEVLQPEKIKGNTDFENQLRKCNPDFLVVVAYGKIIPENIFTIPKYYSLNIHGSLLPQYRGASPIQESLKHGDKKTWLTIMQVAAGMDTGPTFKIEEIKVDIVDKTPDIFQKFAMIGPKLLLETMREIVQNWLKPTPQDTTLATHCSKIEKEDGRVFFHNQTAEEIYDTFRAYFPWPGIYSYYDWKKFIIEDCFFDTQISWPEWSVVTLPNKVYAIHCARGILILKNIKLEWKKSMDINSFINGNKNFLLFNFE